MRETTSRCRLTVGRPVRRWRFALARRNAFVARLAPGVIRRAPLVSTLTAADPGRYEAERAISQIDTRGKKTPRRIRQKGTRTQRRKTILRNKLNTQDQPPDDEDDGLHSTPTTSIELGKPPMIALQMSAGRPPPPDIVPIVGAGSGISVNVPPSHVSRSQE